MALLKFFSNKWASTTKSGPGCLSWCFGSGPGDRRPSREEYRDPNNDHHPPLDEEVPVAREPSEGASLAGSHRKDHKKMNGSAYAYDDADTSSDSDDEVLRRYQQTMGMQRVPSKHSIRSHRSAKSSASKASKASKRETSECGDQAQLMSRAEQGAQSKQEVVESDHHEPSGPEEDASETEPIIPVEQPHSAQASSTKSDTDTRVEVEDEKGAVAGAHEYKNSAFTTEDVSPDQHSSERNADTASMSIGDVEQDEHLFDVSDLQDVEPQIISKCGNLEVTFCYDHEKTRMSITVHRAQEIPSKDRGGANNSQVRLLLLPTKKVRHKTKIKPGENPEFQEAFQFKVPFEEINNMGVRLRLYGCERMRRERMIGESVVGFASLNHDTETTHMLTLEPRSNLSHGDSKLDVSSLSRSDSASSTQSMQHGGMPELLIGLAYNGTTGRLSVEVIKGSNFRNMAMNRAPDTYVKLTLMSPNGQEIARSKTSIRRGQPNPLYKETFMFQVALFQLPDVTLMTSVYNKRSMKRKEMIGWFSLGLNNSGEEELAHWNDMRESKGEQVCRWHVLLES